MLNYVFQYSLAFNRTSLLLTHSHTHLLLDGRLNKTISIIYSDSDMVHISLAVTSTIINTVYSMLLQLLTLKYLHL